MDWQKTSRGWRKVYSKPCHHAAPSGLPCPRVITDTMDLTEHVDGRFYDSKSAFRAVTKANGMIEVGNDPARNRPQKTQKRDDGKLDEAIHRAIAQTT